MYEEINPQAKNLAAWLELGREADRPVQLTQEALSRTGQRAMEEGEVHVFDVKSGEFIPASTASHSGTGRTTRSKI